jgi:hypothetical protein
MQGIYSIKLTVENTLVFQVILVGITMFLMPPTKAKGRLCVLGGTYGDCLHPESDQVRIRNVY